MSRRKRNSIITSLIIALIAFGFNYYQQSHGKGTPAALEQSQPGLYSVSHFVDGDTIAVSMNGKDEKVRFIGVDTPETHKPNTPVQCYGPAAAAFTKSTIGGNKVRLEADPLDTDRDRYGRLLRYVYLPDGTLVNEQLIRLGYGFYYPYFPFSKKAQFAADQQAAITAHKGLWGNCSPTPTDGGGYLSNPQG
jgi:endonuclease YncB( thermonuclease family)